MPRQIIVKFTLLEAECLVELAEEAEMEIMSGNSRRWKAAHSAIDKMLSAINRAESSKTLAHNP